MLKKNHQSGFIFLEILIAVALVGIVFITLLTIGMQAVNVSYALQKTAQVNALMQEEMEAVRSLRDGTTWATNGIGSFIAGSNYYAALDNSVNPPRWAMQSGTETTGVFTRRVVFDRVSRDPSTSNIEAVYNAARDDANTRKVTVTVTYGSNTYQTIMYLTNWQ